MIYRAIALSLAIMVGLGAIAPLTTVNAESKPRAQKHAKKYKKYSKKWWRAYRARVNRQKTLNTRKRGLRLRQIRLANTKQSPENGGVSFVKVAKSNKTAIVQDNAPAMLPTGEAAPKGWKRGASSISETQYRVDDETGLNVGSAAISVVGPAVGADSDAGRNKTVGGIATSALRRTVIDRMIKEEGWVVNDYNKEVGDRKVYVVAAKSAGAGGAVQSRLFYFVESDGRIYSVLTSAPDDKSKRIEEEAEKVINSMQRKSNPVQQAELKP